MNNAFRVRWLANFQVVSKYHSPEFSRRGKSHVKSLISEVFQFIDWNKRLVFFKAYTKTSVYPSVGDNDRDNLRHYSPPLR